MSPLTIETNDLIYEGIATMCRGSCDLSCPWAETNDLIYEGIATPNRTGRISRLLLSVKQTTWFTKGLRRYCDAFIIQRVCCSIETNDLIYEGIATAVLVTTSVILTTVKQTTWFTKGLRHWWGVYITRSIFNYETNDLIYEGIATNMACFLCSIIEHSETNDLIYEGIATLLFCYFPPFKEWNKRPDLRRDCDR